MPFGDLFDKAANWANEVVRDNIPANVRAYAKGVMGNQTPIDESFFSEKELNALRHAASGGWAEWGRKGAPIKDVPEDVMARLKELTQWDSGKSTTGAEIKARRDELRSIAQQYKLTDEDMRALEGSGSRPSIQYSHYGTDDVLGSRTSIVPMLTNPDRVAATTIGRALIEQSPDGDTILTDRYKFNRGDAEQGPGLFPMLDRLGEKLIPSNRGFDVRVNLGNSMNWPSTWQPAQRPPEDIDLSRFTREDLNGSK